MTGMLLGILSAVGAGCLWTVLAVILSRTARRGIDILTLMAVSATVTLALSWAVVTRYGELADGGPRRLGELAGLMIASGICNSLGVLAVQKAMRTGHHGMVWTISQSGFVLPFLTGVVLFGEPLGAVQWLGVGSILASVICLGIARSHRGHRLESPCHQEAGRPPGGTGFPACGNAHGPEGLCHHGPGGLSWFALALVALVLLGLCQALATVPTHWQGWEDRGHLRVPVYYIGVAGGFAGITLLRRRRPGWSVVPWALVLSVNALVSVSMIFVSMDSLRPFGMVSMTYPIAVGTCITAFAGWSLLVLREPVRPLYVVGLLLGVGGILLAALRAGS